MSKNVLSKTKLVDKDELEKVIQENELEGWKVVSQKECNGRIKVTFQIVK